jgi:ankyrin repeat protein
LHGAHDANTVQLLVRLGANVDARDANGRTPLQLQAATPGSLAAVRALVEAGANPRLLDKSRKSALQLARASGSPDVVTYLETQL